MIAQSLKKHRALFRASLQRELTYRFNFLLGRLRNIVVMLLLYFLWTSLTGLTGRFAGYSREELTTYVLGMNLLRGVVFGGQARQVAADINDGMMSTHLLLPVNHFLRTFSSELAQRALQFVTALAEVVLFAAVLRVPFLWQTDPSVLALFSFSLALSTALSFSLSYLVSLLAFWSREATGPRFLFDWVLEFASGAYFPLDVLPAAFAAFLRLLPFASIIYLPLQIYLGRLSAADAASGISLQAAWTAVIGLLVTLAWRRGLQRYAGEGI